MCMTYHSFRRLRLNRRERAGREQSDEALMSCTRDAVERINELQNHIREYRNQVAELQVELERERERFNLQVI